VLFGRHMVDGARGADVGEGGGVEEVFLYHTISLLVDGDSVVR
jgi:hypothetical protein